MINYNYKPNFIAYELFEFFLESGREYEGFVAGLGYTWTTQNFFSLNEYLPTKTYYSFPAEPYVIQHFNTSRHCQLMSYLDTKEKQECVTFLDNDDIIFVVQDADGKLRQLKYKEDGNFYWMDTNKKYDGSGGNETLDKVLETYKKIETLKNDNPIKKRLHTLRDSKRKHYIYENESQRYDVPSSVRMYGIGYMSGGAKSSTQTVLNLSEERLAELKKKDKVKFTESVIIVHEMQHQYDFDIGNMKDFSDEGGYGTAKSAHEIRAVYLENMMRKILKLPKRNTYNGIIIDWKGLQNFDN